MDRRKMLAAVVVTLGVPGGALGGDGDALLAERIDVGLARAVRFLLDRQHLDGSWRSETYGCFRDDPALTALALSLLIAIPGELLEKPTGHDDGPGQANAVRLRDSVSRGTKFLVSFVTENGEIRIEAPGLAFPEYTAAAATGVLALTEPVHQRRDAEHAWLRYLLSYRFSSERGWRPGDPEFGGWGYQVYPPLKPEGGLGAEGLAPNLSSTLFGLGALRFGGIAPEDPVYGEALQFVQRCQNFAEEPEAGDPVFDDGGFFFTPLDEARNKAGRAGEDRRGRRRFHSYGSTTSDGVRALLRCGLASEHPRLAAAVGWLERRFRADRHPGSCAADREALLQGTYYYYCWSVTHALLRTSPRRLQTADGEVDWPVAMAEALLSRQFSDGSWSNAYRDAKEDDPLVAGPLAAAALTICRQALSPRP